VYTEFPTFPNGGLHRFWTSGPEFLDLRRDTHSWASLDAWVTGGANLAGKTQPVRVTAAYVSGGLLETLAVAPIAGRLISQSDDAPGAQVVADISYGTWQSAFAADPHIVGRETYLDGLKCIVIGVMPKGFQFPPGEQEPAQIWTALRLDPANPGNRGGHNYYLLGRLLPGVTAGQAQGELASLVQSYGEKRMPKTHSFHPKTHTIVSFPLQAEVVSSVRPALLMLLGAVVFVLLIANVNVANLLLARAEARRREIAIRGALGAGLVRLARQFLTEGVLLAFCGAVLGMALSFGGVRLVQLTNAGGIPRADEISVDWRVLLFTLGTSLITGVLFGLAPLAPLLLSGIFESLKDTAGSTTAAAGAQIFRRLLVAGELAMALVLLIGCGLMLRAFWKLQEVHTGLSLFSIVAFAIATVGIYGVVSYSVARRTKEFGLRMVLGAQGGDVLGLVMKQGAGMVAIGVAAGLATAFALTRLMASLLFGVTPTDLPTFAGVTVLLFAVALVACYLPARRATRVDPMQTLRYE
jgi:predicted permease